MPDAIINNTIASYNLIIMAKDMNPQDKETKENKVCTAKWSQTPFL